MWKLKSPLILLFYSRKNAGDGRTGKSSKQISISDKAENSKLFPSLVESKSTSKYQIECKSLL